MVTRDAACGGGCQLLYPHLSRHCARIELVMEPVDLSSPGVLDRVDRVTQLTEIHLEATLTVPPGTDHEKAQRLLEKAEQSCLISNSLTAKRLFKAEVHTVESM